MKKIIISGLVAGVVMLVTAFIFNQAFYYFLPVLKLEYSNTSLYRAMDDPVMMLYFLHPLFLGFILAFVWNITKDAFVSKKGLPRGIQFGLIYWLIVLPGLFISYICSPFSLLAVCTWGIVTFAQALLAGLILEKMNA